MLGRHRHVKIYYMVPFPFGFRILTRAFWFDCTEVVNGTLEVYTDIGHAEHDLLMALILNFLIISMQSLLC